MTEIIQTCPSDLVITVDKYCRSQKLYGKRDNYLQSYCGVIGVIICECEDNKC